MRMSDTVHAIVGAGQTGANAAVAMREAGFAGRIVLIGDEQHAPYERPPLSKAALIEDPAPEPAWVYAAERYESLGIEAMAGVQVMDIDMAARRLLLSNGGTLAFDRLLLATGGRPRLLKLPGAEHVHYMRSLEDAQKLRPLLVAGARVVCIGAGVIGLEVAASARHRGCEVTVLEAAAGAMGRSMTQEMAHWIERLHTDNGVQLYFDTILAAIEPGRVLCANGSSHPADVVVAGVGMLRNVELAQAAGLEVDGGIVVDEFGRTGIEGISAAGDVAAFWHPILQRRLRLESWKHAQNHGIAVGRAMAGVAEQYDDVPWFWTDQHGVNVQVAGLPNDVSDTVLRGDDRATSFSAFHLDALGRMVAATGVNAPRDVRAALTLIRAGAVIDRAVLADPATKLQALAKAATAAIA
jgi:3-phenylpropionate/trans-cinnamate dioxygenase ferredoxin reductase component